MEPLWRDSSTVQRVVAHSSKHARGKLSARQNRIAARVAGARSMRFMAGYRVAMGRRGKDAS